ncbi:DEAD/DEAH box helicase [Flaviaesturariibacter aridisoli]|uniref:DEAD-box ATP-dependent RNA helicase RhpA n=1 Tax=Flaviaesturariibacter aridisoli TaxID=2545761 RepID=A0A4R4E6H1_9BACT|nr:DEAD/DEAH box helicase [Flaviaesturariibacter aridisoli]TCZ74380.1 DEAD/DEAH box helicase [Flaviaesturariibacter aridisoli]
MTFDALGLQESILRAVQDLGFTEPTTIQEKAIPVLLSGTKDLIGLAQTGTGKTAAFGLPLLQLIDAAQKHPQALVVCPTRELCMQIVNEIELFKKYERGINVVAVYGGTSISQQIRDIRRGVQVVVATPGRLIDLIERKAINLEEIQYVVLDEADEMLSMGFQEDIEFILQNTPKRNSTWLFSATMPPEIRRVTQRYMKEPFEITVGKKNTANKNIDHQFCVTTAQHRYETLKRIIDFNPGMYGIIFTRTKADAQEVAEKLTREGYDIDALHGDLSQGQRDKVMDEFREKTLQLLIATDVAARGIDVSGITHVINYELPDDVEVYTHRSGRTGRAGKTGVCLSIVHQRESFKIKQIERIVQLAFNRVEIPTGKDVCRKQFFFFMDKLTQADISHGDYATYLPMLEEKFADMSKEEVLQRVAALEFDRFLRYYENAEDLNLRQSDRRDRNDDRRDKAPDNRADRKGKHNVSSSNMVKLFVNLGTKDGFYKASFLQFILDLSDLPKDVLGRIDLKELNTWMEVDQSAAQQMMRAIDGKKFKGRRIRMNEADSFRK